MYEIDFNREIIYGSDQMYISYPCRFASVVFNLVDTNELTEIADEIEGVKGGEYEFYISINDLPDCKIDNCITVYPRDGGYGFNIDLSETEMEVLYKSIDAQCKERLGKGCEEMLEEANEKMLAA